MSHANEKIEKQLKAFQMEYPEEARAFSQFSKRALDPNAANQRMLSQDINITYVE